MGFKTHRCFFTAKRHIINGFRSTRFCFVNYLYLLHYIINIIIR